MQQDDSSVCKHVCLLGGSRGMPPQENFECRSSRIASGTRLLFPVTKPYSTSRFLGRGNFSPPPLLSCINPRMTQYFLFFFFFFALTCPFVPSSSASSSLSFHLCTRPRTVVNRIKTETGTSIIIPADDVKSDTIRIEGDPKGVAAAKAMLLEMAAKMVKNCYSSKQVTAIDRETSTSRIFS